MRGRGRTAYRWDTEGWTWGETWATWWHIERLMSISRHTSQGERLDGWDGLGFPSSFHRHRQPLHTLTLQEIFSPRSFLASRLLDSSDGGHTLLPKVVFGIS